ncbi:hypothetical protein ABES25_09870 [Bacillus gobiensis]
MKKKLAVVLVITVAVVSAAVGVAKKPVDHLAGPGGGGVHPHSQSDI